MALSGLRQGATNPANTLYNKRFGAYLTFSGVGDPTATNAMAQADGVRVGWAVRAFNGVHVVQLRAVGAHVSDLAQVV